MAHNKNTPKSQIRKNYKTKTFNTSNIEDHSKDGKTCFCFIYLEIKCMLKRLPCPNIFMTCN